MDGPYFVYDPRSRQWLNAAGGWTNVSAEKREFHSWGEANRVRRGLPDQHVLYVTSALRSPA